eukprot:TRINITY_DN21000_c0_g1_i1.p2 TRINITY_DN21000_c0_g1~~TRINITY_DN21000_c0_g1_i1.p2  ORF type:complete len:128 (+),score=74.81 TRINITY_DN21000_c0_g1_i1:36-386(+)
MTDPTLATDTMFHEDLPPMMYGFGDEKNPLPETVDALNDLVVDFIHTLAREANELNEVGKLKAEHVLFVLRKDVAKWRRGKKLLKHDHDIAQARRVTQTEDAPKGRNAKSKRQRKK